MNRKGVQKLVLALRDSEAFDPGLLADLLSLLRYDWAGLFNLLCMLITNQKCMVRSNPDYLVIWYINIRRDI